MGGGADYMLAAGHDVYFRHTLNSVSLKTKTDSRMCVEVLKMPFSSIQAF